MKWSGNFIPKWVVIADARGTIENALRDARRVLENNIQELSEAQERLVKFRFRNKPVAPFISKVSPELIKRIVEAAERVNDLETRLQGIRRIAVNDNMPQKRI